MISKGRVGFKPGVQWDEIQCWLVCTDADPFTEGYHLFPKSTPESPYNLTSVVNVSLCGVIGEGF